MILRIIKGSPRKAAFEHSPPQKQEHQPRGDDEPMSFREAGIYFPRQLSACEVRHRATKGYHGVVLMSVFDGGEWWTTKRNVETFIADVTRKCGGVPGPGYPNEISVDDQKEYEECLRRILEM